ncbi:hypothetical protein BU15DRAFT_78720 [Melanogaster broomeanus]|nr:hypothetical protein BU15DRAFT_78720 [Melanogaster broomeanus]
MTDPSVVASSSTSPPASSTPSYVLDRNDDEVILAPTEQPSSPLSTTSIPPTPSVAPRSRSVPRASTPIPLLLPQASHFHPQPPAKQMNISPRHFPPPGTLVVVQGVVHTTDVPRPTEGSPLLIGVKTDKKLKVDFIDVEFASAEADTKAVESREWNVLKYATIVEHTKRVLYLEDDDIAHIAEGQLHI